VVNVIEIVCDYQCYLRGIPFLLEVTAVVCSNEHYLMFNKIPEFDHYYVAYLKDDPAKEPIATSYSSPGVLAEAAHKTGRAKADFELREIGREEYERIKALLL
jgi:hypothetical protein